MKPRILVVHSSADLYGSDKSLLAFLTAAQNVEATVVLPEDGPLVQALKSSGIQVEIQEVLKVQRKDLSPGGLIRLVKAAWSSWRSLKNLSLSGRPFDAVYSNTLGVLGGALYAKLQGIPHVWHVREILSQSRVMEWGYRTLVKAASARVICNSSSTRTWIWGGPREAPSQYQLVWNGVPTASPDRELRVRTRRELGFEEDEIVFALVGRINDWKGQTLALEAFEKAVDQGMAAARLLFVGSAYRGSEHYEHQLTRRIDQSPVRERVTWVRFRSDVEAIWNACDVALVPSTEPEPFGRVAIEAMALGKPVIAAAHGGLVDIVEDGVTGILVPPKRADDLAAAMLRLMDRKNQEALGRAGQLRQQDLFSVESYARRVEKILTESHV